MRTPDTMAAPQKPCGGRCDQRQQEDDQRQPDDPAAGRRRIAARTRAIGRLDPGAGEAQLSRSGEADAAVQEAIAEASAVAQPGTPSITPSVAPAEPDQPAT